MKKRQCRHSGRPTLIILHIIKVRVLILTAYYLHFISESITEPTGDKQGLQTLPRNQ